jgi:enoyl-CoA hydratase
MRENDFPEGVRALLVDRDNKPVWSPSQLEDISPERIEAYFSHLGERELELPDYQTEWRWSGA